MTRMSTPSAASATGQSGADVGEPAGLDQRRDLRSGEQDFEFVGDSHSLIVKVVNT